MKGKARWRSEKRIYLCVPGTACLYFQLLCSFPNPKISGRELVCLYFSYEVWWIFSTRSREPGKNRGGSGWRIFVVVVTIFYSPLRNFKHFQIFIKKNDYDGKLLYDSSMSREGSAQITEGEALFFHCCIRMEKFQLPEFIQGRSRYVFGKKNIYNIYMCFQITKDIHGFLRKWGLFIRSPFVLWNSLRVGYEV